MDRCSSALKDASDTSEGWKAFLHLHCSSAPIGRFTDKTSTPENLSLAEALVLEQSECNLADIADHMALLVST